ncbi:MAG: sigma-54 dependent transcriptional regulator [Thermoanaerobacterales bacterium]|nr:sigma-54 dependent transcriptional regulator [Bacillota bacterium]MDI6906075.1 sigma-54 dependent transcriptional regulator [Thermoanaerobacterales bacterium]
MTRILVVDDEESVCQMLSDILADEGYRAETAGDGREALEKLKREPFDVALVDIRMPEVDGMQLLEHVQAAGLTLPVIMMTAYGTTETAIQAMKLGAFDYVLKPFNLEELLITLRKAVEMERMAREVAALRRELAGDGAPAPVMVGRTPVMQELYKQIGRLAASNATVLILGESGTGKELVAGAIHQNSARRNGPFVKINCAALPENLLESELFGHERGAFTGAVNRKSGKFEIAHGGTILLDEVSEISPVVQAKLLRVLQEREFERVGGTKSIRVDVRLLAATNKDLEELVREGLFREDLYFRLNVVSIRVPPLRERKEDIPLLVDHYLKTLERSSGKTITGFSPEAMSLLTGYDWPGNVRELKNVCERVMVMATGPVIMPEDLPYNLRPEGRETTAGGRWNNKTLKEIVADVERTVILRALREHNGNRSRAAEALGINRRSLYAKLKEYGLDR